MMINFYLWARAVTTTYDTWQLARTITRIALNPVGCTGPCCAASKQYYDDRINEALA